MDQAQGQADDPSQQKPKPDAPPKSSFWRRPAVIVVGTVLFAFLLFLGLRYLAETITHESTDDAFLDGDITSIAPKVAGQVRKVHVVSNQKVEAGDLLVEIDPRDLQVQLEQKRAALDSAHANVELIRSSLALLKSQIDTADATAQQTAAEATASEATADKARTDLKRAEELRQNNTISVQEFDTAKTTATWAEANLNAARQKAASDRSKIAEVKAQFEAGHKAFDRAESQAKQADWDVQQAQLNLSYTRVTAPEAGQVTRKAVEDGDYVQPGQRLMALVLRRLWVTANFKETQLKRIRPGQPVSVTIDSLAGRTFAGHVESIQAGSGARFSLLPPENAVGNYVKVVQRVPVRILFDAAVDTPHVLGPGMSVVPLIRVKDYTIPEIALVLVAIILAAVLGLLWWRAANKRPSAGSVPSPHPMGRGPG